MTVTAAGAAVVLACLAWAFANIALLFALTGAVINLEPGNRALSVLGILAVFCALNAWTLDSLGRSFGY